MRIATTVAGVVMVLAMAAPAMSGGESWKRDDDRGKQHVRYGNDSGDHRDGDRWRRDDDRREHKEGNRWRRDGDHRWSDGRRGDDDRRGGHDWWRDGKDGDRDRRYGDRDHPGRHLGHRKHDKDKWDHKDKDKWHGKDKDKDKDKHE